MGEFNDFYAFAQRIVVAFALVQLMPRLLDCECGASRLSGDLVVMAAQQMVVDYSDELVRR